MLFSQGAVSLYLSTDVSGTSTPAASEHEYHMKIQSIGQKSLFETWRETRVLAVI
jgi:hypothetical protein